MASIKATLSISRPPFEQAQDLARKMQVSRSRFFVLALDDYLRRKASRQPRKVVESE